MLLDFVVGMLVKSLCCWSFYICVVIMMSFETTLPNTLLEA